MSKLFSDFSILLTIAFAIFFSACSHRISAPSQDELEQDDYQKRSSMEKTLSDSELSKLEQIYEAVQESGDILHEIL